MVRADWDFRLVYSELSSAVSLCCGPRFFPPWLPDWRHSHYAVQPPPMTFRLFVRYPQKVRMSSVNIFSNFFFFFFLPLLEGGGGGGSSLSFLPKKKGQVVSQFRCCILTTVLWALHVETRSPNGRTFDDLLAPQYVVLFSQTGGKWGSLRHLQLLVCLEW